MVKSFRTLTSLGLNDLFVPRLRIVSSFLENCGEKRKTSKHDVRVAMPRAGISARTTGSSRQVSPLARVLRSSPQIFEEKGDCSQSIFNLVEHIINHYPCHFIRVY